MNITDEMIPVCGEFALESFASYLGDSVALEGALSEAKDSIKTKIGNMKDAVLDKIKKTSKGKSAEALKKDKKHILMEQAKVASAAKESRALVIALKENQISSEEFTERFKAATEAVRISKAIVGIGSNSELTLQDLQDYTSFLNEAGTIIDEAMAGLESFTEKTPINRYAMSIDNTAVEGVWNCAYSAYTRNCESAMEGMNITKKPLTKQEFQAVFNQERVREDENLRNAIAHGKYSRTELTDMGLLKEDSDELGKGEYEQLLVDYEKELNEMKGKDEDARKEYVKEHKLPHHLIHCIKGDALNDYEGFLSAAKAEQNKEKANESISDGSVSDAEESARVGSYTIVTKAEELEDPDKKTAQVKHNEAEAKKVAEANNTQSKQDKMPEDDIEKGAPKKMNKAQEGIDDSTFLEMLDEIIELGDEEAIAAIEALVNDDTDDEAAYEGKLDDLKSKINDKYLAVIANKDLNLRESIEELEKAFRRLKNSKDGSGKTVYQVPKEFKTLYDKTNKLLMKAMRDSHNVKDPEERKEIEYLIEQSSERIGKIAKAVYPPDRTETRKVAGVTESAIPTEVSTDKKDMDEAARKFSEQAEVVKEHLVAVKPRYAKDRKGCAEDLARIMKEVENLLPHASEITDNDEKVKAYDYITQQRAALQKALDNIPPDNDETEASSDEVSKLNGTVAAEGSSEEESENENENEVSNANTEKGSTKEESEEKSSGRSEEVRILEERNRKILLAMKESGNRNDDSLATDAIQCRIEAKSLLKNASEEDSKTLNAIIDDCSNFIRRYGNAINNVE